MRAAAEARLAAVAAEWRPTAEAVGSPAPAAPIRTRGWSGPALRGLAVLTVAVVAISCYAVWQARPRDVVDVPLTLATGPALAGGDSAPVEGGRSLASSYPDPTPSLTPTPPGPASEVVVHVTGLVAHPGLVRLGSGRLSSPGGSARRPPSLPVMEPP